MTVQVKEVVDVLQCLVVWHVPYKEFYLRLVWLWRLPATTRGREGGPVPGYLIERTHSFRLGESRGCSQVGGREGGG